MIVAYNVYRDATYLASDLEGWVSARSEATWYTDEYRAAQDARVYGGTVVSIHHDDPGIIGSKVAH